jgi:hypothetical protein
MLSITHLWMPIVLSAVLVFVASSLIHMVFKWHNADFRKLPNEDEVRAAINKASAAPGQYVLPHCTDMKEMQAVEMQKKYQAGPIGFLVLRANGTPRIGPQLGQWFALNIVVALIVAHVASGALMGSSPNPMQVFHTVGVMTFLTYAGGSIQNGIWMGKPWGSVAKDLLDALIYGAISGAVFAWLWPH